MSWCDAVCISRNSARIFSSGSIKSWVVVWLAYALACAVSGCKYIDENNPVARVIIADIHASILAYLCEACLVFWIACLILSCIFDQYVCCSSLLCTFCGISFPSTANSVIIFCKKSNNFDSLLVCFAYVSVSPNNFGIKTGNQACCASYTYANIERASCWVLLCKSQS